MKKQELISTAKTLDISPDNEKFYEYAVTYLKSMGNKPIGDFYNMLKLFEDNYRSSQITRAVGISGKSSESLKKWCSMMRLNIGLKQLDKEDYIYVMKSAAMLSKIKSKGLGI